MWLALNGRFACQVDLPGRESRAGRAWEVTSISHMLSAEPEAAARAFNRVLENLLGCLDVDRPGGVLLVRGPADQAGIPAGILAEVAPLGGVAIKVRLAIHGHGITLDEARALARPLASLTL